MKQLCKGPWVMVVVVIVAGIALLFTPHASLAQLANCTLSGTVYDASGAVVPHAKVVAKDVATNSEHSSESNAAGFFTFPVLLPGTYDVIVSAKGFKTWSQKGIVLNNADNREIVPGLVESGGSRLCARYAT